MSGTLILDNQHRGPWTFEEGDIMFAGPSGQCVIFERPESQWTVRTPGSRDRTPLEDGDTLCIGGGWFDVSIESTSEDY
ncbi:MAG: hypothetical protein ABEN55_03935 [Bradymonadaceae bacterium]